MASGSSAPKLNSIDNLVQATLKRTAPVPNIKIGTSLASSFLAPALRELDKSGTSAGVNALQLCTSALKDGSDALDVLIPDSRPEGRPLPGLGAAYVL